MNHVPYLFVNLIAMCGYAVIFIAFIAAKKNREVKSFIALITAFLVWCGGSILMRIQAAPGLDFWYYVSILSLFCIAPLEYIFVCTFTRTNEKLLRTIWFAGTFVILVLTAFGVFLKPPQALDTDAGVVFVYDMGWEIIIPYVFFICVLLSIFRVIGNAVRRTGYGVPGMNAMMIGCIIIAIGNLMQIVPGNIFPWDTLSGIVCAGFMVWALYKRRMFKLTLLISRGVIVFASLALCFVTAVNFVEPANRFITQNFGASNGLASSMVIIMAVGFILIFYAMLTKLINSLFTREEHQRRLLKDFSAKISQTLDSQNIMKEIADTIRSEISTENIYICLREGEEYKFKYVANPLSSAEFSFRDDIPLVEYAKNNERCFTRNDVNSSPLYRAIWDSEKMLFRQLDIECILTLTDDEDIIGFVLLARKERGKAFTVSETAFLETIGTLSSIAMKNANLYEQMAREAITDTMTGTYNYRYFTEVSRQEFDKNENESLALIFIDIDDFRLYNQLYGADEGDYALKTIAGILQMDTGENGYVFRSAGKTFAVLLRNYDVVMTRKFAENIQRQISEINGKGLRAAYNVLTASCGICVAPYGASTCRELVDNADLATFRATKNGRNSIVVFRNSNIETEGVYRKVDRILDSSRNTILGDSTQTIFALIAAIDAKDHYTAQHSKNVAEYAALLAAASGMNNDQIRMVYAAGLLHDIGKISIPESVLCKDGPLSDEEYEIMKEHVNSSIDMIRYLPSMDYLIPAAIGHHERWDGKGYPHGAAGEEIPLTARCLAIADAFDAMTTDRVYRKGMSVEYAAEQLKAGSGTQFDPHLVELFIKLLENNEFELKKHRTAEKMQ